MGFLFQMETCGWYSLSGSNQDGNPKNALNAPWVSALKVGFGELFSKAYLYPGI